MGMVTVVFAVNLVFAMAQSVAPLEPSSCLKGEDFFNSRNYSAAQNYLWDCVIAGAPSERFALHLTWAYRETKNYDDGLSLSLHALEASPENEDLLYVTAFLYFRRGEFEKSVGMLNKAYKLHGSDWRIHQLYALNFVEVGWSFAAEEEFNRAIDLNPDLPELHYQLARYYYTVDLFEKAIVANRKALALAPSYIAAYDSLGQSYAGLGNKKSARENFTKAVELVRTTSASNEWPLVDYASFLTNDSPGQAIALLKEALVMNPHNATATYELGRALRFVGRNSEAEVYLGKTVELDPSYTEAYYILSILARKRGAVALANDYLGKFEELRSIEKKTGTTYDALSAHHR